MSYKVAPLTVNPKQKSSLSSKVFVSQPSAEEELLVGRLFVLMEIDASRADDFAVADFIVKDIYRHYYENEQFFLRDKIANLKIDYIFESALTKLNRGIAEFLEREKIKLHADSLTIVIGVLHKNRLLFAHTGSSKAMLVYRPKTKTGTPLDYQLLDISEKTEDPTQELTNPSKLFANVINGQIPSHGYFIFTNESVLEYLSKKQLTDIITTLPPAGAAEQLRGLLEQTDAFVPFFALIVKNTIGEEHVSSPVIAGAGLAGAENIMGAGLGRSSVDLLNTTQEKTEQLLSPSGFTSIKKWINKLQPASSGIKSYARDKAQQFSMASGRLGVNASKLNLGRKLLDILRVIGALIIDGAIAVFRFVTDPAVRAAFIASVKSGTRNTIVAGGRFIDRLRNLSPRQKILLGIIVFCLCAFGGNLIYSTITARQRAAAERLVAAREFFEQKEHQLEASLLYNNTEGARQILGEMDAIVAGLSQNTDEEKAAVADLTTRYHARLDTLYNVSRLDDSAIFAELPGAGDSLTLANGVLYSANGASKTLYSIAADKSVTPLPSDEFSGKTVTVMADEDDVYFWDGEDLVSFDAPSKNFKKATIQNKPATAAVAVYNTRLYAVSTAERTIYRFNQDRDTVSFSNRMAWLRDNLDASAVGSISVNGKVYLIADNQIRQYGGGNAETLTLDTAIPALEDPKQVLGSVDQTVIYILEPKHKRVLAYGADGKYIAQYTSDQFTDLKGMAVDEDAKKLYILNGTKIYQAAVK